MKHARSDYDCIQPWPTKRPHTAKLDGVTHTNISKMDEVDVTPIIPDDEPVFLIRAQDLVGPDVVEYWANRAQQNGAERDIVRAAFQQAEEMRAWQQEHGSKVPDAPAGAYNL